MTSDQIFQLALASIGVIGAIAGALVGALAGAIYQQRQSAPRLKVNAAWAFMVGGSQPGLDLITISCANVGPLPMQVTQCGLLLTGTQRLAVMVDEVQTSTLPKDLGPGQAVDMRVALPTVGMQLQELADRRGEMMEVRGSYARDATGKEWHGTLINLRDLRAAPRRP